MDLVNKYYYFKKALSNDDVERIIKRGEERLNEDKENGKNSKGVTFGLNHKSETSGSVPVNDTPFDDIRNSEKDYYTRDSDVTFFSDEWLFNLIMPYVQEANWRTGWCWNIDTAEPFQFTRYSDNGFYGFHADGGSDHFCKYRKYIHGLSPDPLQEDGDIPMKVEDNTHRRYTVWSDWVGKVRKISVTVNLTDGNDYDGGDLKFDYGKHDRHKRFDTCTEAREKGSIIVFPSFLPHCVTPVTRGTRTSLVMWCLGEPWK